MRTVLVARAQTALYLAAGLSRKIRSRPLHCRHDMTYMWLLARHGIHHALDITDGMVLEESYGRFFRLRRGTVDTFELPVLPGWRLHEALLPIKGMPRHAWLGCASGAACKALELQRSWGDRRPIRLVHQTVVIGLWIFQERVLRHLPGVSYMRFVRSWAPAFEICNDAHAQGALPDGVPARRGQGVAEPCRPRSRRTR